MSRNNYPPFSGNISAGGRLRIFRTADELTNTEFYEQRWNGSTLDESVLYSGTGTIRTKRQIVDGVLMTTLGSTGFAINYRLIENIVTVTATGTVAATTKFHIVNSATATDQTLPTATNGVERVIKNIGAGTVTLIGTIDGATGVTLATNQAIRIVGNGTTFYKVGGA